MDPTASAPPTDSTPGKYCFACGKLIDARAALCPACGVAQPPASSGQFPIAGPPVSGWQMPASPIPGDPGSGFSIASIVLALVSTLFLPIVFGPLAIILAAIGLSHHERWAKGAMITAIVCMLIGFALGALVYLASVPAA